MCRIVLRADSHGRYLAERLLKLGHQVDCVFKPSAPQKEVVKVGSCNPDDVLVIIGGTNDTWSLSSKSFSPDQIHDILHGMDLDDLKTIQNKVIYVAIPKRMGVQGGDDINALINKINGRVFNILRKIKISFS